MDSLQDTENMPSTEAEPIYQGREGAVGSVSTHVEKFMESGRPFDPPQSEPKTLSALHADIQAAANAEADRAGFVAPSLISDTRTELSGPEIILALSILEDRVRYLEALMKRLIDTQHRDLM